MRSVLLGGLVAAAVLGATACSSGGVSGDALDQSAVATAPPTTAAPDTDLCGLLDAVAAEVDSISETDPPAQLEASMQGVVAFQRHGPDVAPPEVATEVQIVAELYGALVDGLEDSGWDWGAFTTSDHALRVSDLRADPATGAALAHMSTWATSNC